MTNGPRPALSVVIPCRDATGTLPLQLAALAGQHDAPPFEVILADNRSRDDLPALAARWRERLPGLRVVAADALPGAAFARNVGARSARSDRLLFLDADDRCAPHTLAHAMRAFEHADLFSGSAVPVPERDPATGGTFENLAEEALARVGAPAFAPPVVQDDGPFPVLMGAVFGCTAALFQELGGFDASLAQAGEDNELAVRARAFGEPVPLAPTVHVAYRYRVGGEARRREVRGEARAHVLIATRYGLWERSRFRHPLRDLARCAAAGALMLLGRRRRDGEALAERATSARSILGAVVRYRVLHLLPRPLRGAGLLPDRAGDGVEPAGGVAP